LLKKWRDTDEFADCCADIHAVVCAEKSADAETFADAGADVSEKMFRNEIVSI
jgi:hypothetical protein